MCKFCEAMQSKWRADAVRKDYDPEAEYRYSVAIVCRRFEKGRRGCQTSHTDYRWRQCGYKLEFCPECGRKLTKNSAIDDQTGRP